MNKIGTEARQAFSKSIFEESYTSDDSDEKNNSMKKNSSSESV